MITSVSTTRRPLSASIVVPPTPSTAPVLEFRCLYTSDLRRKQKRWQDGRLKYHTFNKRVMVYDERSNFVGDTHWREDYTFAEGEEVELERGGILVEVSELVGRSEQDLSELLDKRANEREQRISTREAVSLPPQALADSRSLLCTVPPRLQLQNQLSRVHIPALPSGPTPKFAPLQLSETHNPPSAKRRRLNESPLSKSGYAQNLTGAILSLSMPPRSSAPRREDVLWAQTSKHQQRVGNVDRSSSGQKHGEILPTVNRILNIVRKLPLERPKYATNITGAILNLNGQPPTRNPGISTRHDIPDDFRHRAASDQQKRKQVECDKFNYRISAEKDDSLGTDTFDTSAYRETKRPSGQDADGSVKSSHAPAKSQRAKSPLETSARQPLVESHSNALLEEEQPWKNHGEQLLNPLRLKSRPKKKLLHMSDRHCWTIQPTDTLSKSRATTIEAEQGPEQVQPARHGQAALQVNNQHFVPRRYIEDASELHGIGRVSSHLGSLIDEEPATHGRSLETWTDDDNFQGKRQERERLLSNATPESEAFQTTQQTQDAPVLHIESLQGIICDLETPNFKECPTLRTEIHSNGRKNQIRPEMESQAHPEDNDNSLAEDSGIDHFAIDALLSRHLPGQQISRMISSEAKQPGEQARRQVHERGLSLPLPQTLHQPLSSNQQILSTIGKFIAESKPSIVPLNIAGHQATDSLPSADDKIVLESMCISNNTAGSITGTIIAKRASPRVINMSNKGARSKEVVGYVLPVKPHTRNKETPMQTAKGILELEAQTPLPARSLTRSTETPAHAIGELSKLGRLIDSCLTAKSINPNSEVLPQSIHNTSELGATVSPHIPAKLVNPATRGKKAASKADAAGKVPETVVPPIAAMAPPPRRNLRNSDFRLDTDGGSKTAPTPAKEVGETGPWSREAFDLFDWKLQVASLPD